MATFSIRDFQTTLRTQGLARSNRFEVFIGVPKALTQMTGEQRVISLFCESTNLPVQTIGIRQQKIYGPTYPRPMTTDYGGEGLSMTFLVDSKMFVKGFFDAWMKAIVQPFTYHVNYQDNYATQIILKQLNEQDKETYIVTIDDAFPRNVSMLEISNTAQNQVHKLNVTFTYRRWNSIHYTQQMINQPSNRAVKTNPISPTPQDFAVLGAVPVPIRGGEDVVPYDASKVIRGTQISASPNQIPLSSPPTPRSQGGDSLDNFFNQLYGK